MYYIVGRGFLTLYFLKTPPILLPHFSIFSQYFLLSHSFCDHATSNVGAVSTSFLILVDWFGHPNSYNQKIKS